MEMVINDAIVGVNSISTYNIFNSDTGSFGAVDIRVNSNVSNRNSYTGFSGLRSAPGLNSNLTEGNANVVDRDIPVDRLASCNLNATVGMVVPASAIATPLACFITGVMGNILALVVMHTMRRDVKQTAYYVLLVGLAWTDLLGQITTSPVVIAVYANKLQWVGGQPLCDYHAFVMIFFGTLTPILVCTLACERFLALICTYSYSRFVTPRKVKCAFVACWIVVLLFSCVPFMHGRSYNIQYPGTWCFLNYHNESPSDSVYAILFSSINITAILLILVMNASVCITLVRMRRRRRRTLSITTPLGEVSSTKNITCMEVETQMVVFLGMISIVFVICWIPLSVNILINVSRNLGCHRWDLLTVRIASINQILDPWMYILLRKSVIHKMWCAVRRRVCGVRAAKGVGGTGTRTVQGAETRLLRVGLQPGRLSMEILVKCGERGYDRVDSGDTSICGGYSCVGEDKQVRNDGDGQNVSLLDDHITCNAVDGDQTAISSHPDDTDIESHHAMDRQSMPLQRYYSHDNTNVERESTQITDNKIFYTKAKPIRPETFHGCSVRNSVLCAGIKAAEMRHNSALKSDDIIIERNRLKRTELSHTESALLLRRSHTDSALVNAAHTERCALPQGSVSIQDITVINERPSGDKTELHDDIVLSSPQNIPISCNKHNGYPPCNKLHSPNYQEPTKTVNSVDLTHKSCVDKGSNNDVRTSRTLHNDLPLTVSPTDVPVITFSNCSGDSRDGLLDTGDKSSHFSPVQSPKETLKRIFHFPRRQTSVMKSPDQTKLIRLNSLPSQICSPNS